jgi:nucleotide-binding universal stress UspA family protein
MTSPSKRKILLALDVSPRSRSALEIAAALASALDLELAGLFVEDANLLRLSGLPFAREIGLLSAQSRPMATPELERALQREAAAVQLQLAETARRRRLRWSFRVARGQIATELFALAGELDMVVIGKRARAGFWPISDRIGARSEAPSTAGPVMVVYDGSAHARAALELAAQLARDGGLALRVLVSATSAAGFAAAGAEVRADLARASDRQPYALQMFSGSSHDLAIVVRVAGAGVLVVRGNGGLRRGEGFATLLNDIACPVVMLE